MTSRLFRAAAIVSSLGCCAVAQAAEPTNEPTAERIIIIRHGEKPPAGLGQLACRGLARALALPDVILSKFGAPDAVFAPNPARRKPDAGKLYDYIRPLATIEPLAIRVGLPVDLRFAFGDAQALARVLSDRQYAGKTIVVAWEHHLAVTLMRELMKRNSGDARLVEDWKDTDFDRMDVIEIMRIAGKAPISTYRPGLQGLNGIPGECPGQKAP